MKTPKSWPLVGLGTPAAFSTKRALLRSGFGGLGPSQRMSSIATASSLDHLVLTVKDLEATIKFYEKFLGMRHTSFTSGGVQRHALAFGKQKINLHVSGKEFEPKAQNVQPGSGDLCFLIDEQVDHVVKQLHAEGLEVLEGGGVVNRTGARGKLRSVYIRDPDGNLVEYVFPDPRSTLLTYAG